MADLIILNARILTMAAETPRAEAIAITGNRISAVGATEDIRALANDRTHVIDAGKRTVLPGFIDSHVHLFQGSAEIDYLSVGSCSDLPAVQKAVTTYLATHNDEPLILGVGAGYGLFADATRAPRLLLDDIVAERPFALLAPDLHTVWANTKTLEMAGLLNGADMPEGSTVVMGPDNLATGLLLETGAFGPALALSRTGGRDMLGYVTGDNPDPPATAAEREADKALLLKGLDRVARSGITALHNMDGNFYQLDLLSELEAEGRLTARVQVPFHLKNTDPLERLQEAEEMHASYCSEKLWSGRVKMFMDGVLESHTALKTRAYPEAPHTYGEAVFDPAHFNEACCRADAMGLQISVHAVGDLAVQRVLDGYELAQSVNGRNDARHRIEHIELITEADLVRLKSLDVVASMQPRHAAFGGFFEPPVPGTVFHTDECARAFAWRTIRDMGIPLAFSTDWPVVPVDPLANMQSAIAPSDLGPHWPDQSQSLAETLHSYTSTNAWLGFRENLHGRLVPGLAADIVVLDGDIEAQPPEELANLDVAMTVFDGRIVYSSGRFDASP